MAYLRHLLLLFLAILLITHSPEAQAASATIAFDWSKGIKIFDGPEYGEGFPDRMDIESAYYGSDDNYHYFRIDLLKDPNNANPGDSYAFFLDTKEGGLQAGTGITPSIPTPLKDIDIAIGSTYVWADGYVPFFSEADTGAGAFTSYEGKDYLDLGGKYWRDAAVLEWAIPRDKIGDDLVAWAATYGLKSKTDQRITASLGSMDSNGIWRTYDITSPITRPITTPIPAAVWLFTSGLVALGLGRRKAQSCC